MNWQMIFRLDTWGHMTGSFFGVWMLFWLWHRAAKLYRRSALEAATLLTIGFVCGLELYQAAAHPEWFTWFDTIKDMVMNATGITLAVIAIRGGR